MSNQIKAIMKAGKRETTRNERVRLRKHLNADALFATMRAGFNKINDHRPGELGRWCQQNVPGQQKFQAGAMDS